MADNYLEKQYEEYMARKNTRNVPVKHKNKIDRQQMSVPEKNVFVTGGARGIGRAIVEAFRKEDYKVSFCDCDKKNGSKTAQDTGARFYPIDVTDVKALESCMNDIFKRDGDIDVLINNVGVFQTLPIIEASVEDFDKIIAINLRTVFITSRMLAIHRKLLPELNPFGRIINICSTRYAMSESGTEAYSASKGGVYSLTHSLAISLSEYYITVNSISPGWIQNDDYAGLTKEDHLQHPSRRVGKPEDIARMCLFLSHEHNDFINGENITIDGGMTKKMIYRD